LKKLKIYLLHFVINEFIRGKLIPEKLEEMIIHSISLKEKPFMVALTAGTTVLGS
jgi:hypothetical protein